MSRETARKVLEIEAQAILGLRAAHRRVLRPRGRGAARLHRPRRRQRDGQERAHRPEDLGHPLLDRHAVAVPASRGGHRTATSGASSRATSSSPSPTAARRRRCWPSSPGCKRLGSPLVAHDGQPALVAGPGRRRPPRRLDPRGGLPARPRPHRLHHRRPGHGRRAGHGPAGAARLHRRRLRGPAPGRPPRQEAACASRT